MQQLEELTESLRAAGGRITPQRVAVIDAISKSSSHPTVDQLFEQVSVSQPSLSKKTVYQIVNDLAKIGALTLLDVGTGQLRIDTVESVHDHFVCSNCKTVVDIPRTKNPEVLPQAKKYGEIDSVEVVYRGTCKACS